MKKPKKAPNPEPKPKTCEIGQVLPISVIQLLAGAPHNDTVRAVILAHLKQPIPAEHKTFEAVKEWIETTIVFNKPKPRSAVPADTRVNIPITGSAREHGRCAYHRDVAGRGIYAMGLRRFLDALNDSEDMETLMDTLNERIGEDWEDFVGMNQQGEDEHDDHEQDDEDGLTDQEWDYQQGHRENIINLIRQHAPDLLERFHHE